MTDIAERMFVLFRGCDLGHGTYTREDKRAGSPKTEIKKTAKTLRVPPSVDLWDKHLSGERPIGIIPITAEAMCWWGVIDVDTYDLSHADIAKNLKKFDLPLHVCRSKSGGAHLFVFMEDPVSAGDMMTKLRELAAVLGYGESEIFPKQTELLLDRGDLGNWLNMPYFDSEGGTRYAVDAEGRGLSVERFLERAEATRIASDMFMELEPLKVDTGSDLSEAPPCLQHLAAMKVSEGGRNNALFAFGVLAKKMSPDSWESLLESWNHEFLDPPLATDELSLVIRSLRKKEYAYRCKDQPICSHCDSQTCRTRRFGVGSSGPAPAISSVSVLDTDPPLFFVCLADGGTVECSADDFLTSRAFQKVALNQLRILLPLYKQDAWLSRLQECLDQAVVIEAPADAGVGGAFRDLLQTFCTDRFSAQSLEEILMGKPWLDEDREQYVFRLADVMGFLDTNKFRDYTRPQVIARIREMGGDNTFKILRGRGTNLWMLPVGVFSVQDQSHSVPRTEESPI